MLDLPSRKAASLPARVSVELYHCPVCGDGFLQPVLHTGRGQDVKSKTLAKIPMPREFSSTLANTSLDGPRVSASAA